MNLSEEDRGNIATFNEKTNQLRDDIGDVISGHQTGLIIVGEGGTGKTFVVTEYLKGENIRYQHHEGRLTARRLFEVLKAFPNDIHLIEDCESMFHDKLWTGIARNALWSQDTSLHSLRRVTWGVHHREGQDELAFEFRGGAILISNVGLDDTKGDIRALLTRVPEVQIELTQAELIAKEKEICLQGFSIPNHPVALSPEECWEVMLFIEECRTELQKPINFRTLIHGFNLYHSDKTKTSNLSSWQSRIRSKMKRVITPYKSARAVRVSGETKIALEINAMDIPTDQKQRLWEQRTRHSFRPSFYRALKRSIIEK